MTLFYPYYEWEDYRNGMYDSPVNMQQEIIESIKLLSNEQVFKEACEKVTINWPNSTSTHLHNAHINRRAWIGQAACCFNHAATERATKIAWKEINPDSQKKANSIAQEVINEYHRSRKHLYNTLEMQRLF
jgi:hypothetical protein